MMRIIKPFSVLILPAAVSAQLFTPSTTGHEALLPSSYLESPSEPPKASVPPLSTTNLVNPTTNLDINHFDVREIVTGSAATAATGLSQMPAVTTIWVGGMVDGVWKYTPSPYTQLFSSVPDQGELPKSGSIGLGTIPGTVGPHGVKKTKRDASPEATAAVNVRNAEKEVHALKEREVKLEARDNGMARVNAGAGSALALSVALLAAMIVV